MKRFDESVTAKLWPKSSIDDFKDVGIYKSPHSEKYKDDDHESGIPDAPDEELVDKPEVRANYVNTKVMLPRGDHMARGKAI